ncbi:MAG: 2-dehydro-3-deoxygalactonokinase [Hyphomicrobiales bacterium]|nr:2-dehydro-3-deoxygalactonokinase [Hyphomicrobiales bacterium]
MSLGFIALDWGTTRLRGWLIAPDGSVRDEIVSDEGIQVVAADGFAPLLRARLAPWLAADAALPIWMAGMVGSRNGWIEVPYVPAPCSAADLRRGALRHSLDGHDVWLVPGVSCRSDDGFFDVMRGEETLALGAGVSHGLICQPGTHSKWIEMRDGAIASFATFITGEIYAAMSASFIARLAATPVSPEPGASAGRSAAQARGGVLRGLFQARARVLGGTLPAETVKPFISSLLVAEEISGARKLYGAETPTLIAAPPHDGLYSTALGAGARLVTPQMALLEGLKRIRAAA